MYDEYSFIGIVDGEPMEFVSDTEYLEYIADKQHNPKAIFSLREFHAQKENPYTLNISKMEDIVND